MRKAGIREARQNLSALLAEVAKGREVLITDRGRVVARLAPALAGRGVADHSQFRKSMPTFEPPVSEEISRGRDDRF